MPQILYISDNVIWNSTSPSKTFQIYTQLTDCCKFNLFAVDIKLNINFDFSVSDAYESNFEATWALIVTWEDVLAFGMTAASGVSCNHRILNRH